MVKRKLNRLCRDIFGGVNNAESRFIQYLILLKMYPTLINRIE